MAGKKKSEKESSWIGEIEKYSRQIWLAGLGAYSKVSKDGSKLFETLAAPRIRPSKRPRAPTCIYAERSGAPGAGHLHPQKKSG